MNLKSRRGSKDSFRFQAIDGLWPVCLVWGHPGTRLASQALIRKIRELIRHINTDIGL